MKHWDRVESMLKKVLLEKIAAGQGRRYINRLMFLSTQVVYVHT